MKQFIENYKYQIILCGVLLTAFLITFAHQGSIIIDCGREVYYPEKILSGSVLYKDLFNIYGPFSYLANAFLYKVFGSNLNTLYFAGMAVAAGIVAFVYLISRLFFDKVLTFSITLLTIVLGVLSFGIFNFVFPYSFAMTYGLLAFLISLYFLILFTKTKKEEFYFISIFFASIAVCSKYEFLPYLLIYPFMEFRLKFDFTRILFSIVVFLFVPSVMFGFLFNHGLTTDALISNFKDIIAMSQTDTLKFFYTISGLSFEKPTLGILIRNFFKSAFPLILFIMAWNSNAQKRLNGMTLFIASVVALAYIAGVEYFVFLPILLIILLCINYKKQTFDVQILSISALLVSLKVIFSTVIISYGMFFIPILLIAVICFVKPEFRKPLAVYLIILSCVFAINNFKERQYKTLKLKTEKGFIYNDLGYKDSLNNLVDFISKNTKKSDKVVIFPEGLFINFLSQRNSDDYYNSMLPLYIETFGEDRIIAHFKKDKPNYIILHNFPTSDYYFKSICKDYGIDFCNFVNSDYEPKTLIGGDFRAYVFEKK